VSRKLNNEDVLVKMHKVEIFMSREFINTNVTPPSASQMLIVDYMLDHKDSEIYQKDLENILGLRRATVSGVLKTMEKHNLIKREISSNDVRCKKVMLTNTAIKHFESGKKKFLELRDILFDNLSEKELKEFSKIINKMNSNIILYEERDKND